jgi:hypothetical protein
MCAKKLHVLEGAQGRHQMFTLRQVQICEGGKQRWSLYYHNSGNQTTSLHAYQTKVKMVFLSKETTKQMKWHKEGKHDSEDSNIMSHPADGKPWQVLTVLIQNFQGPKECSSWFVDKWFPTSQHR